MPKEFHVTLIFVCPKLHSVPPGERMLWQQPSEFVLASALVTRMQWSSRSIASTKCPFNGFYINRTLLTLLIWPRAVKIFTSALCRNQRLSVWAELSKLSVIVEILLSEIMFSQYFAHADKGFLDVEEGFFGVFMVSNFASAYLSASFLARSSLSL